MENDNRNAYSEVIEILKLIDDEEKLEALPMEMLEVLKEKSNPEYKPQISMEIPLDKQNLQPETFSILSWIAQKYWNEEMEEEENTIFEENNAQNIEEVEQEAESTQENTEQEKIEEEIKTDENSNMPILYKDLKWYEKIRIKIVEFLNRIFKRKQEMQD